MQATSCLLIATLLAGVAVAQDGREAMSEADEAMTRPPASVRIEPPGRSTEVRRTGGPVPQEHLPGPVEQCFRRTVFNVATHNRDDHIKNFAFVMDPLAQTLVLICKLKQLGSHQRKVINRIHVRDL